MVAPARIDFVGEADSDGNAWASSAGGFVCRGSGMTGICQARLPIRPWAEERTRLAEVRRKYPQAQLLDADTVSVVYLTLFDPLLYHEFSIAFNTSFGVTRQAALRRMFRPLMNAAAQVLS